MHKDSEHISVIYTMLTVSAVSVLCVVLFVLTDFQNIVFKNSMFFKEL